MTHELNGVQYWARAGVVLLSCLPLSVALANPTGPSVSRGNVSVTSQGSTTTIRASDGAYINWQSFNIGLGETTSFIQPSSSSVVWNRINDPNPTQILGTLDANGYVFLQNSSGFYVGGRASINAGGLLLTTASVPPPDLAGGGAWSFNAPPPAASIVNYGQVNISGGGPAFLIAHNIENHGSISAPEGQIGLYAGREVLISERPDGHGINARVTLPAGSVSNDGRLVADAGTIMMQAQLVNQGGLVQANSVRQVNGVIQLVASEAVNLGAHSHLEANGGTDGISAGGSVLVQSQGSFSDQQGSTINVAGGAQSGNGGTVEISAPNFTSINSAIDGHARPGYISGSLLIDPDYIVLAASGASAPPSGTVGQGDPPGTLTLNVNTFNSLISQNHLSHIDLQARRNITISTLWRVPDSMDPDATLTLQAGQQISVNSGAGIWAGRNWTLNLTAGADFMSPLSTIPGIGIISLLGSNPLKTAGRAINLASGQDINVNSSWSLGDSLSGPALLSLNAGNNIVFRTGSLAAGNDWEMSLTAGTKFDLNGPVTPNAGGIYVNNAILQAVNGNITMQAFNEVRVANGAITTTGGGSVDVAAIRGSVFTGSDGAGYNFGGYGYAPYLPLGGISTGAGGDVIITAGLDVISFPAVTANLQDAGSGAFGLNRPGMVTVFAGRNVTGHFVAADSVDSRGHPIASTITAGHSAGTPGGLLSLSLIRGGWQVTANDIDLQEVRNPNGVFNDRIGRLNHLFDYAPGSFVDLNASDQVDLDGTSAPRGGDAVNIVYPPSLMILAGAGGIMFNSDLTLFPAPNANLDIFTSHGGSVFSQQSLSAPQTEAGVLYNLVMSDSGQNRWTSEVFGLDHASRPVHLNDPVKVVMDISGNLNDLNIVLPKAADITVHGNMDNSSFSAQNLRLSDVTSINVSGRIYDRSVVTYEQLNGPLPEPFDSDVKLNNFILSLFDSSGYRLFSPANTPVFNYNPDTHQLAFTGHLTADVAQRLTGLLYQARLDAFGRPEIDPTTGRALAVVPVTFIAPGIINYFVRNTMGLPSPNLGGYSISGPGTFSLTAASMTLADPQNQGISSAGASINPYLVPYTRSGADIVVTTTRGDLSMFASTINTVMGGNITINSAGAINLGTREDFGFSAPNRGVYTESSGNISMTAAGDINVYGSRIATFDGGNIAVQSTGGSVDAGNGSTSDITLALFRIDPVTDRLQTMTTIFNGSGIMALTLPLVLTAVNPDGSLATFQTDPTAHPGDINITAYRNITASQGGIVQEPLNGNLGSGPTITLSAGSRDAFGNIVSVGNIDVTGSGVIGGAVRLNATGAAEGLVIGRQDITINAVQSFSGVVLSGGTASVNSGGSVSGTIIGVGGVNVGGGGTVSANLISANVSVGGAQAQSTLAPTTASATSTAAAGTASSDFKDQAAGTEPGEKKDDLNKKARPVLVRRTSRVTVLLP